MQIKSMPVIDLSPHPENPRTHSKSQIEQIAKSIQRFGFKIPILIDKTHRIICGHGRVLACEQLGTKTVPCIVTDDLSDSEVRALMIADNRLTENSDWDTLKLAENFKLLCDIELDFDVEITGFEYGDIEQLILEIEPTDSEIEETLIQPVATVVTRPGDLWRLGEHLVLCGDALDKTSYTQLLGRKRADIVFTDPPYNLAPKDIGKVCEQSHGAFKNASGEMSPTEFTEFLASVFVLLTGFSKSGSIHYVCMDWRHLQEIMTAGAQHYSEFKNLCIWAKDKAGMGTFYRSQHELVFVFKHGTSKHQNHFKLGQHGRTRANVWNYPTARHLIEGNGDVDGSSLLSLHPTIKPVQLVEDALLDCSRRRQRVLDPFLGSGTSLIAAEKTQRVCYGLECEPRYVDVAIERWQNWTGKDAVHVASGQTYQQLREHRMDKELCHG